LNAAKIPDDPQIWWNMRRFVEYDLIISDAYCDAYGNNTVAINVTGKANARPAHDV
jgi:hypothetical protein